MTGSISIGRREFLAGSAALGFAGALPSVGRAATPKQGGHFRIGCADYSSGDSLDPALSETRFQLYLNWQIRNNLIEMGNHGNLVPELAESWEGSKDAKTWVFKLRKGVEFHNGKSFTSADAIYSIDLHRKAGTHSNAKPLLESIADVKATGPHELTFTLSSGNVGFPYLMAFFVLLMIPEGETDFAKGVGTGGYILETFEPGVHSVAKRNPNYWKTGRAHFDSVEILAIKDVTARTSALLSKRIDAYNFVDLNTVKALKRKPGVKVLNVHGKTHYTFPMLMDKAPFTDNDVRLAMKYAIDREAILKKILNGYGKVGNDQPISAAYRFYNPDIPQHGYDPEKAKFHLKKAGHDGLSVQLYTSEVPYAGATDASLIFRESAKKAGIKIEVVRAPEDGYWTNTWAKKPLCAARWSGRIDEDVMIGAIYSSDAIKSGWSETHMSNKRLDQLLVEARTEFDEAKRRQMYYEMQRIIHDDGGAIVHVFADIVDATSDKVAHGKLSPEWDLDGGRASERWWFA